MSITDNNILASEHSGTANVESATPIVSCEWLRDHIDDDNVRILDASWHLPAAKRDARQEFVQHHVPGAVFFDIDEHSAPSALPHMLPEASQFAAAVGTMGVCEHHTIVVYDTVGLFSAARLWWMFRHFGAAGAVVLDGGLPAWLKMGGVVDSSVVNTNRRHPACSFQVDSSAQQRLSEVADAEAVLKAIDEPDIILDARAAGRFSGQDKEARAGLRSGHIPGSVNLPFLEVLDDQGLLKSAEDLRSLFALLQIEPTSQIITTCGSGVTAAVLSLALEHAGFAKARLYDGSWSEWGALDMMPVATGSV